jgi:hypothetical protein
MKPSARFLRAQFQFFTKPTCALAAETLNLERTLSNLVNQACALARGEIELIGYAVPD